MLRHIVLIRVNDAATSERVQQLKEALASLPAPGRVNFSMGPDLGLRPGNVDVALVADFEDAASFLAYDEDPAHIRIRRELIAPIAASIERCQYEP
jgi:hypothetical protein